MKTPIHPLMKKTAFPRLRAAAWFSRPVTRFLRAMAFAVLFCAAAALPLQAATSVYFTNPTSGGGWATDDANWSTSSSGTSGSDWVNGNYAYFFSTGITPANPYSVTIGSAGVSTARITDVNSPGNLTFNSSTITLVGGANLTGYCLIRNETANEMIFNSVIAGSSVGLYTGYSSGTIVLGGDNTYSGGTIVGAGTLVIQNGTAATGTGNVTVEVDPNNSTLVGTLTWNTTTATIPGSVTVGGASGYTAKLGPCSGGIASLHIGGSLTFNSYSEPILSLSSTYSGANDQVAVTSTLTCGGVQVGISCGSTLDTSGNDYVLFTSGGVSGSFSSTPIWTATTPNYASQYTIITSGNQVHLHFTPIAITVTAAANTKTYDGTTSAAATPTYTGTLASGDSFSPTETYAARNAGTGLTLTPAGTVSGGNGIYTYTYNTVSTGVIYQKALTVSGITAASTVYDGTTTAKLGGTAAFAAARSSTAVIDRDDQRRHPLQCGLGFGAAGRRCGRSGRPSGWQRRLRR
jgi:autotransporter-associated beta strand protein